ncbi:hypothetical protein EJW92_13380 [Enterococcus faecium]|nr:hypothetical protein [Enterococcus faecium]
MVPIRVFGSSGGTSLAILTEAINYASQKGFPIINFSIGSVVYSSTEEAIKNYPGLFVAAAGNNGIDMTDKPFYPASLDIPNIITVGNSSGYERSSDSNYSKTGVDLFARGFRVFSTFLGSKYTYMSGTSMATPHVTGSAALALSLDPDLSTDELKKIILNSVDSFYELSDLCLTGGRLNTNNVVRQVTGKLTASNITLRLNSEWSDEIAKEMCHVHWIDQSGNDLTDQVVVLKNEVDTSNFGDYEVVFASPDLTDQISVTVTVPRLRKLTLGKETATIDIGSAWDSVIAIDTFQVKAIDDFGNDVTNQVQVTINADIDTINSIQAVIKFEVPELGLAQIGRLNITAKNSTINGLNEVSIEHIICQINYENDFNSDGTKGETLLTNGTINPYVEIKSRWMRYRIVNGSNARNFTFNLDNDESFYQIATDGGFLNTSVKLSKLLLAPGERAEILVDTQNYKKGKVIHLLANNLVALTMRIENTIDNKEFNPSDSLNTISTLDEKKLEDLTRQSINLSGMSHMVNINNKQFDMERIDLYKKLGTQEIWEVNNISSMMGGMIHPFHIHGVQFQILSRDGNQPALNEQGWKDTVLVNPDETVELLVKFDREGIFMYHCHILEHEEYGMMGQMEIK